MGDLAFSDPSVVAMVQRKRAGRLRELQETRELLETVKEGCLRGEFDLLEGETEINIPSHRRGVFAFAPFPFEIKTSSSVLNLCATSSRSRRDWIKYIKSRLHTHTSVNELARLYLPQEFVRSDKLARLQREKCYNKYMSIAVTSCTALAKVSSYHSL